MNDIFKDMQAKVGCEYISDLPSYKRKVWHEMKRLNPADYEERQLEDFSKYVFGMPYQTIKDVICRQRNGNHHHQIPALLALQTFLCQLLCNGAGIILKIGRAHV